MNAARARSSLPGILGEIADLVGKDVAYAILSEFGGTRVDIPARARRQHWLTDLVGFDVADKICRHFAVQHKKGVRHEVIPLAHHSHTKQARKHVADALRKGTDIRTAARQAGVHERTVWRVKRRIRVGLDADDDQGDLF